METETVVNLTRLGIGLAAIAVPVLNPVFCWKFNRAESQSMAAGELPLQGIGVLVWGLAYCQLIELLFSACLLGLGMDPGNAHAWAFMPAIGLAWWSRGPLHGYLERRYREHEEHAALIKRFDNGEISEEEIRKILIDRELRR